MSSPGRKGGVTFIHRTARKDHILGIDIKRAVEVSGLWIRMKQEPRVLLRSDN